MIGAGLNRQLALSTLCGLCFALALHGAIIVRLSILLFIPLLPGLFGAVLTGHLPPCGPRPPDAGPGDDEFLYAAMWCNAIFYSAAAFGVVRLWTNKKIKSLRNFNAARLLHSKPPDIPFNTIGSLLEYDQKERCFVKSNPQV